jgi:hypothetical protein
VCIRPPDQSENFVAHRYGAAFVRIETEYPVVPARLDRPIAQIAEALERDLDDARAELGGDVRRTVGAV